MTPKEKAKDLVDKFIQYVDSTDQVGLANETEMKINAGNCALQCCDEILDFYNRYEGGIDSDEYEQQAEYWNNVKEEIEKL